MLRWIGIVLLAVLSSYKGFNQTNIVYILADDLGYGDLGYNGQEKIQTPNIDWLAENGMAFSQHYSGSTVCAPSRSSLLTGLHTGHTAIRGNREINPEGQAPLPSSSITIAEILKKQGYATGCFGKWGLGYPGSEGDPLNQGFDKFYGYNCQRQAHNYFPYHLWDDNKKVILPENRDSLKGTYAPTLIHQQALQFIEAEKNNPFFLFYASPLPHAELAAPQSIIEKYAKLFGNESPFKGVDAGPKYKNGGYGSQPNPKAAYAAMVSLLDEQVGELIEKLESLNLLNETLIIFTSDNGPHREGGNDPNYFNSNGPLRGGKRDLYEGGIRVPMVAYWKGKIQAGISDHVSAFWDFLPTVCDLTGIDSPKTDGISFAPALLGKEGVNHDYLYWEFHGAGGKQALLKDDFKLVVLQVNDTSKTSVELYNLKNDLGEKRNIAMDNPSMVKELSALARQAHVKSNTFPFKNE